MKKISLILAILIMTLPVAMAQKAGVTPDSFLYGLDKAMDNIGLALTFNKEKKAEKGLNIAQERLLEVQQMIEENKFEHAEKAQEQHQKALEKAQKAMEGIDDEEKIQNIQTKFQSHYEKVVQVKNTVLERQRERMNEEQIAHLEEVFGKIKERAEEMEHKIEQIKEEKGKEVAPSEDIKPMPMGRGEERDESDDEIVTEGSQGKQKNFKLLVSDAPGDIGDFESLEVHFSKARIFKQSKPFEEEIDDSVDLTEVLDGKVKTILSTYLEQGKYTKIELYVESIEAKVAGEEVTVNVPNGKLMITKNFEVGEEVTKFVFDIEVRKKGNSNEYNLQPNIAKSGVAGKDLPEKHECDEDSDCLESDICQKNRCKGVEDEEPEEVECTLDEDCSEGHACIENECEPVECELDEDCYEGYECVETECVEALECLEDSECAEGELCLENECITPEPECTVDEDCLAEQVCLDSVCSPQPECTLDEDCDTGFVCDSGSCVEATN